jgi:uncharacterized linocin/CFP29 family protein
MDYVLNGQGVGSVATRLMQNNWDCGALRPFIDEKTQKAAIIVNQDGEQKKLFTNAPTSLRKDAWIELDNAVVMAARQRLKLVGDLRSAGLVYNLPNGMSKTVLETESMGDIEDAEIGMDPANETKSDEYQFNLTSLPLPVVHKGFSYTARQISVHQNSGTPLDTTQASMAARRVAEKIEKLALGVNDEYAYGGGSVYGLINYPGRVTTTISDPSLTSGWDGSRLVQEILNLKELAKEQLHYGPFSLYMGTAWDRFLDDDYSSAKGSNTLRERVNQISAIDSIETLDYLPGYQCVLVQKSSDVIRMVMGSDITTVQWESMGGLKVNFKVLALMVPQVREDFYGRCGVVHATAVDNS